MKPLEYLSPKEILLCKGLGFLLGVTIPYTWFANLHEAWQTSPDQAIIIAIALLMLTVGAGTVKSMLPVRSWKLTLYCLTSALLTAGLFVGLSGIFPNAWTLAAAICLYGIYSTVRLGLMMQSRINQPR
jgi:hypothetical protein